MKPITAIVSCLAGTLLGQLLADEASGTCYWLARRLIRSAGKFLPADQQVDRRDEWLGEMEALGQRPLSVLRFALWVRLHARATGAAARGAVPRPLLATWFNAAAGHFRRADHPGPRRARRPLPEPDVPDLLDVLLVYGAMIGFSGLVYVATVNWPAAALLAGLTVTIPVLTTARRHRPAATPSAGSR